MKTDVNNRISLKSRVRYLFIFLPIHLLIGVIYIIIGNYTFQMKYYTLSTGFDDIIPFVPQFEFIYLILYILPIIPIFTINQIGRLKLAFASFIAINMISFVFFFLYPVYCPKPFINTNTVSEYLLSIEHSMDTPMNSFPSLHAGVSLLVFFWCRGYNRYLTGGLFIISIMIGASAVLIKQHYALDIAGGFILAFIVYKITLLFSNHSYLLKKKIIRKICW